MNARTDGALVVALIAIWLFVVCVVGEAVRRALVPAVQKRWGSACRGIDGTRANESAVFAAHCEEQPRLPGYYEVSRPPPYTLVAAAV